MQEGFHAPQKEGNIYITCILKCIDMAGGFMPGNRRVNYLYEMYSEIY
jgi:hypothetical protein